MLLSRTVSSPTFVDPWQSEADRIRFEKRPIMAYATLGALAAMLAVLVGILPFVEVDRVVSTSGGKIVQVQALSTFQALDTSVIRSVDVRDGDQVAKGQTLGTLDPTFTKADESQLRQQVAGLDAQIARAQAEQGRKPLVFPATADQDALNYQALERALYTLRAAEFKANSKSFDDKIKMTQATIAKLQNDMSRYAEREKISHQVEDMRSSLYKSGSNSLLNLLEANDNRLEVLRTLENDKNALTEAQHQLSSLQADRDAYVQGWFSAGSTALVTAQNQRDTAVASLEKASKHQDLVHLAASEPSVVLKLSPLSAGSVLKQGDTLMTLMPTGAAMAASIDFSASDIGFVRPGNHVLLKLDAFPSVEHGVAEGTLEWISEDSFTTNDDGKSVDPYYKARVSIDKLELTNVPKTFRLIPGMTLQGDINTGTRSAFKYVMGALFSGVGQALREP